MIHLVVTLKGRTIGRFDLDGEQVRIGRHPDNEVQIDNMSVSRFHCTLTRNPANGAWILEDAGSHNGTFVNSAKTPRKELRSGDVLSVGQFSVAFRSDDGPLDTPRLQGSRFIAVRPAQAPEVREEMAPEKGFLVPETEPANPILLRKDLFQVGSMPGLDLQLPSGPPKCALIVRGYGGFQVVNPNPLDGLVKVDGRSVPDCMRLEDDAQLEIGTLKFNFQLGMPSSEHESTMIMELPKQGFPPPRP